MVQSFAPFVRSCARRKNCSLHDSEDIIQDFALSVIKYEKKKGSLPPAHHLKSITERRIADSFRRRAKSPLCLAGRLEDDFLAVDCHAKCESNLCERLVEFLLAKLRPATREIVERHFLLGESVAEIASAKNLTANAIRLRLRRANKALRRAGEGIVIRQAS
jgi:RNA polymerase sigma factor (sigma-70 family)